MELTLVNSTGDEQKEIQVSDSVFGRAFNEPLIHQTVIACLANNRQGTKKQKNRADARGGGVKPWRQKGTGRARAGTIRSPIWRGGGKTFAARPQDHSQKVNRKMYRGAMQSILSELARQGRLLLVEDLVLEKPKTKDLISQLKTIGLQKGLVITGDFNTNVYLSSRNVPMLDVIQAKSIDPVKLVKFDKIVMTVGAIRKIEEVLG